MEAYKELTKIFTRLSRLGHLASIANWDAMVNMPPKGAEARGAAMAELDVTIHDTITNKRVAELLGEAAAASDALADTERANLREMQRAWNRENKLSASVVERKALITSRAEQTWRKARPANDWAAFLPLLREVVDVSREVGRLLAEGTTMHPYEALMDQYEPGMTIDVIERVFADVKSWLPALIREVMQRNAAVDAASPILEPQGPFPVDKQKELGLECMRTWQFDFEGGRLDVSSHPFCGGVPQDVRLTTRYTTDNFDGSLMGIIHETGHAKYEQNRPQDLLTQPASEARSMGVHESQSLFAEMQIARSASFMRYLAPRVAKHLGEQPAFTPENLTRLYRRVRPGFIRVDADELCYPMHVILRYEIEKALIDGSLSVDSLPDVWAAKMQEYLGIDTVGNYKDGCMQDVHWSIGALGYFPTYTLGAMYAAQLMAAMRRDLTDAAVEEAISSGELTPILAWQKDKIWRHGSLLLTDDLVRQATGEPLNPKFYRAHLEARYRDMKN